MSKVKRIIIEIDEGVEEKKPEILPRFNGLDLRGIYEKLNTAVIESREPESVVVLTRYPFDEALIALKGLVDYGE